MIIILQYLIDKVDHSCSFFLWLGTNQEIGDE